MSRSKVKTEQPVITPELFSEEQSWEDCINQFETTATINCWNDEQIEIDMVEGTGYRESTVGIQEVSSDSSGDV